MPIFILLYFFEDFEIQYLLILDLNKEIIHP